MARFEATIDAMNKFTKLLKRSDRGPDIWINTSLVASVYEPHPDKSRSGPRGDASLPPEVKFVPPSLRPPLSTSIALATFKEAVMEHREVGRLQVNPGMVAALRSEPDSPTTAIYLIGDTTCTLEEITPYNVDGTIQAVAKKLGIELSTDS